MDLNHDYDGSNSFTLDGAAMRLQCVKAAILSYGDMGYTDPTVPDIRLAIGQYSDAQGIAALESALRTIITTSQVASSSEINSIQVVSPQGSSFFQVQLDFTFGSEVLDVPALL